MTWTWLKQHQQRGAQLHNRADGSRPAGTAPREAVEDRAAQDHEQAGATEPAGNYPASPIEDRDGGDITPTAPEPQAEWDEVVQPESADDPDEEGA